MFEALTAQPPDAIMHLMELCRTDKNPNKIDLGAGVYKTANGAIPIMAAVKKAEQINWKEETTKTYVGTVGNADFRQQLVNIILGEDFAANFASRLSSSQTAGGSGALRMGAELVRNAHPDATIWVSTPTWANHTPLIGSTGLKIENYPYYNRETLGVDFGAMLEHLKTYAKKGDVVLFHGCCHNPTGADLSDAQWERLASFLPEQGFLPFIDLAYFGLGRGIDADTYGLKTLMKAVPELILAASCSKNFALYRERVGLVAIMSAADKQPIIQTQLGSIQRRLISMPPNHGAALVARVLGDTDLRKEWQDELTQMRTRIGALRLALSSALDVQGGEAMAAAIKDQLGMFSTLPVSPEQAIALREKHSVYMTNSGRINIAGATLDSIPKLASAILDIL